MLTRELLATCIQILVQLSWRLALTTLESRRADGPDDVGALRAGNKGGNGNCTSGRKVFGKCWVCPLEHRAHEHQSQEELQAAFQKDASDDDATSANLAAVYLGKFSGTER